MSPGVTPTAALPGPVTRRTALVAAAAALVTLGAWALVVRAGLAADDDPGIPPVEVLVGAVFFGWPHALAAATAVVATASPAVAADAPARLLALATSGRRGRWDEWGTAMRAELASITASPRERLRFAAGCALTALRRGWGRSPWIVAAACAPLFAALTVAISRASLHGSRAGSLWAVIYGPPQITLLLVGCVAAWTGRSMRTGLEHAVAALAGILLGVLAAAIPEGAVGPRGRRVPTRRRGPVHAPHRRRGRARRAEGDDADLGPPALVALARARCGRRRLAPRPRQTRPSPRRLRGPADGARRRSKDSAPIRAPRLLLHCGVQWLAHSTRRTNQRPPTTLDRVAYLAICRVVILAIRFVWRCEH